MSDRIVVMREGRMVEVFDNSGLAPETLVRAAAGSPRDGVPETSRGLAGGRHRAAGRGRGAALPRLRNARAPARRLQRLFDPRHPGARADGGDPHPLHRPVYGVQPRLHRHGRGDDQCRLSRRPGRPAGRHGAGGRRGARRVQRRPGVEARHPRHRGHARHADHLSRRDLRPVRRRLGQCRRDDAGLHRASARLFPRPAGVVVVRDRHGRALPCADDAHAARAFLLCRRRQSHRGRLCGDRCRPHQVPRLRHLRRGRRPLRLSVGVALRHRLDRGRQWLRAPDRRGLRDRRRVDRRRHRHRGRGDARRAVPRRHRLGAAGDRRFAVLAAGDFRRGHPGRRGAQRARRKRGGRIILRKAGA